MGVELNGNSTTVLSNNTMDFIGDAEGLTTSSRDGVVKIRMSERGPGSEPPVTVMWALTSTVKRCPDRTALASKVDNKWVEISFKSYHDMVLTAAKAFIKLGLEPHCGVGIIGFNSPEWFISDLGAIFAGGIATGIYTTNSPEACFYVLNDSESQVAVVENDAQLKKILQVKDRLPRLKAVVQYKGKPAVDGVLSWDEFMELGRANDVELEAELQKRIVAQRPNQCCMLIYTSGTTGNPKGVMLSHDNIIWTSKMAATTGNMNYDNEVAISYLPLSHAAAQLFDIGIPTIGGVSVYFAQPDALKGSLSQTMTEVRPTIFMGVPRVWEKIQEGMTNAGRNNGFIKKRIIAWARNIGLSSNLNVMKGQRRLVSYELANALVFKKVRLALGLDRCHYFVTGAAPTKRETLDFFMSFDIPLMEAYGMSETTSLHTIGVPWDFRITSVGHEIQGAETRLADASKNIEGDGEICMAGRHVFMGYLNLADKTKEAIDEDGWLHSGDIGRKDENGYLFITGRLKELIITAGGENIPPVLIEDQVKQALPCISNCMLIGDKQKFLSILLTLKVVVNLDTMEPTDDLAPAAIDWCKSIGSSATRVSQIVDDHDEQVMTAVQKGIDLANKNATSRAQCIQKWTILKRDFSVPGGELGPTLKLKRPDVLRLYETTIEKFYIDSEEGVNPAGVTENGTPQKVH